MPRIAAASAAQRRGVPESVSIKLRPESSCVRVLVDSARSMANPAEPDAATFVSAGLPADGLSQLKAASDAVGATIVNRDDARAAKPDTTAGLTAKASQGRAVVKVLDALVKSRIAASSRCSHNRRRRRSQAARPRE